MPRLTGLPDPGKSRVLPADRAVTLLDDLESESEIESVSIFPADAEPSSELGEWVPQEALRSQSGFAAVVGPELRLAFVPFFPLPAWSSPTTDVSPLRKFATRRRTVAIVLLRLGAYAVGVAADGDLKVTKSDTRYVKGRHKAGGQSQRRFERNREKWVRELFDKACRDAAERFSPFGGDIDHLALGGDRQVLNSFVKRCEALKPLRSKILPRRIVVDRPNSGALQTAVEELWSWRVYRSPQ